MRDAPLTGRLLPVPDYPQSFAFDRTGSILAAGAGSGPIHLVDVVHGAIRGGKLAGTIRSLLFSDDGLTLYAGAKAMTTFDPATAKKSKVGFKGLKDPPNDLCLSADGGTLYAAGGSFIATNDCFVRAFEAATGAPRWRSALASKTGVSGVVALGDQIAATGDHGAVHLLDASTGVSHASLSLIPDPPPRSRPLGGVAVVGGDTLIVSALRRGVPTACFVRVDAGAPHFVGEVALPVDRSDGGVTMISRPLVHGDRAVIVAGYTVKDYGRWTALVVDAASRRKLGRHDLTDAGDARGCALSSRGELVWPAQGGIRIAPLGSISGST